MRALYVLLLAAASLAAQPCTVEGKVTNTLTGRPVAGATVTLRGTIRSGNPPQVDSYVTATDAQGHYRIQGLPPGRYDASASHEGFIARRPADAAIPPPLTLAAGQHAVAALQLTPTGVISGRTVDQDGDPVRGVTVEAAQYLYSSGRRELMNRAGTRSNDLGEYRLAGLAPGAYYLRATSPPSPDLAVLNQQVRGPRPPEGYGVTYYPSAADAAQTAPLEVAAGAELRDVEIRLRPQMLYSVRVKFTRAAPGLMPNILLLGGSSRYQGGIRFSQNDSMVFVGVAPGSYTVTAADADPDHPGRQRYARAPVEVVDSDVEIAELNFVPGLDVSGAVKVSGDLPFSTEKLRVTLTPGGRNMGSPPASVVSPDGSFVLRDVAPGPYELRLIVPAGAYLRTLKLGDRELPDQHLDLSGAGGALTILLATDGGEIDGSVQNAKGEPAPRLRVTLAPDGRLRDRDNLVRGGVADDEGNFKLRDIQPGDYRLFAWEDAEPGAPQDPEFRKPFEPQSIAVKVEPSSRQSLHLKAITTHETR